MSAAFETVEVEFEEETGIGTLTLDRPGALNALSTKLRAELVEALQSLEAHNEDADGVALRAVILKGAEGNFSAGADVNEFGGSADRGGATRHYRSFMVEFPAPIIAQIEGYCLGGGFETAMACDFRFAHADSELGLPEIDLGISPGDGVQFLSSLVNASIAKEIAMTGEPISLERAADMGLVNGVYDDAAELEAATREFAETVASKPPLAIRAIKESANVSNDAGLSVGRRYDHARGAPLRETDDFEKGRRAFADDEYEPEFEGR